MQPESLILLHQTTEVQPIDRMLKQSQQQRLFQRLSPQQIQIMKLLQIPTANLEERIKEELEENPALELGSADDDDIYGLDAHDDEEDFQSGEEDVELSSDEGEQIDLDDFLKHEDDSHNSSYDYGNGDDSDRSVAPGAVMESSFHDFLNDQLSMLNLDERKHQIAVQIIGSIDDDGYLRREVHAIVDDLAFGRNIHTTPEEVTELINTIREFDPPGVAAWTLQECLLLQLRRISPRTRDIENAINILTDCFEEFIKKHYPKIQRTFDLTDEDFRNAINVITRLTPKPGSAYGSVNKVESYVLPDFFVYNNNGRLELTLNARNAPELRISDEYMDMMKAYERSEKKNKRQREAISFIKQKLDSAKWFVDAIRQRQQTLYHTMQAIINIQREFFLTGDESTLKPMILKDVANTTGLDVSTVSRVSNSKFVQTEFGTYKLKFFFSESLQHESGEEVSNREVKLLIQDMVNNEDKQTPLSDDKLKEMLQEKGFNLARRTIAKYREQTNIPVARLRKQL